MPRPLRTASATFDANERVPVDELSDWVGESYEAIATAAPKKKRAVKKAAARKPAAKKPAKPAKKAGRKASRK